MSAPTPATLALLATLADARATYGLRHDDYARYRAFCTRRIQRLRAASGMRQAKGRAGKYDPKPINAETANDIKHVLALVFTVDRYWAYAMDLAEQAKLVDEVSANQKRRHMLKKLKLAASSAEHLEQVIVELAKRAKDTDGAEDATLQFSLTDVLEVRAYAHEMNGRYLFEKHLWQEALDHFLGAKSVYENIAKVTPDATHAALCQSAMDVLDPQLRYCTYHLSKRGHDVDALVELIASGRRANPDADHFQRELDALLATSDTTDSAATTLTFLGTTVTVRNAAVARAIAQARDLADSVPLIEPNQRVPVLQTLITTLLHAEKLARKDLDADVAAKQKVATSTADSTTRGLQVTHTYLAYARRIFTAHRNLALLADRAAEDADRARAAALPAAASTMAASAPTTKKRLSENVRLFDNILANLAEARALPHVAADARACAAIDARAIEFRARRARDLALAYVSAGKYPDAKAVFARAVEHLDSIDLDAEEGVEWGDAPALPTANGGLATLRADLEGRAAWTDSMRVLAPVRDAAAPPVSHAPAAARTVLDGASNAMPVVRVHPLPVPAKPVFFDLAFNAIEFPDLGAEQEVTEKRAEGKRAAKTDAVKVVKQEQAEAEKEEEVPVEQEAKPLLAGWFGGLWGRK
ncbi:signal recognition particle subunit srp68 [Allomyces arbusculus]|nr:signal recognition particle subunit srp68 [Allomyces arbusculus]